MIGFMFRYSTLVIELNKLLSMKFINNNIYSRNSIGLSLSSIIEYHNQGDILSRECELGKINMLVKHLKELKIYDNELFIKFKRDILRLSDNLDGYFGVRLEINIATSLIRKKVKFIKTESPDFCILEYNKKIYIECTSVHISKNISNKKDLRYKIKTAINNKAKKIYCNNETMLFIDITNIVHHPSVEEIYLDKDVLKQYVREIIVNSKFSSVVLFLYEYNREKKMFESVYVRIDNKDIQKKVLVFLDEFYPLGNVRVYKPIIPHSS